MQLHEQSEHVYCWPRYSGLRGPCRFLLPPLEETLVKYTLGLVLSVICFSLSMYAAKNSEEFILPTDVRIGDIQVPHGPCDVTWTKASESQVLLTVRMDGRKPITLRARMVEVKHPKSG